MTGPGPEEEHRSERRPRALKGASILTGINNSEIPCTIRNMHEHGAELNVPRDAPVHSEFLLYVPVDGIAYRSVIKWRHGDRLGVEFTGTEPKPRWRY